MESGCIPHPTNEPLILIRQWQIEACDGNLCAAALLSFFEYWHNIKLANQQQARELNDVAEKHGDPRTQDESLYQWHSTQELQDGILGLYGETVVQKSVKQLERLGFVSIHKNPNPTYKWDKTNHYLYHVEHVIAWIRAHRAIEGENDHETPVNTHAVKVRHRRRENTALTPQNHGIDGGKSTAAIPEITTEITPEHILASPARAREMSVHQDKPKNPKKLPKSRQPGTLLPELIALITGMKTEAFHCLAEPTKLNEDFWDAQIIDAKARHLDFEALIRDVDKHFTANPHNTSTSVNGARKQMKRALEVAIRKLQQERKRYHG